MCKVHVCMELLFVFVCFFFMQLFFPKKKIPKMKKGNRNRHKQNLSLSLSHSLTLCSYRYTKPTALLPTPPVVSSKRCVEVCNQSCINGTGDIG